MTEREFDIVIFGGSGLTGRYCTEQLHKSSAENMRWAVAGRDVKKLTTALQEVSSWVGADLTGRKIIEADIYKPHTISAMAKRTKCLINTVGPYTLWGEEVIKACLEHGTHLLDLSGEIHYNEGMRNRYHEEAKQKGVVVLATAGFDSVPSEMLLQFAKDQFPGKLNTLETFVTFRESGNGSRINTGTWDSIIQICKNIWQVSAIRQEAWRSVFQQPWQAVNFRNPMKFMISKRQDIPGYSVPFIGGDKPVLSHSEFFRREVDPRYQRTQIQTHLTNESLFELFGLTFILFIVGLLSQFSLGRKFLRRYPHVLSLGMFKRGGPTREQTATCGFTIFGVGCGWLRDESQECKPNHNIVVRLDGPEVAYVTTSICIVQSAICLIKEQDRLPMKGGYLTPGFALEKSSLFERLTQNGFKFSVVKKPIGVEEATESQ